MRVSLLRVCCVAGWFYIDPAFVAQPHSSAPLPATHQPLASSTCQPLAAAAAHPRRPAASSCPLPPQHWDGLRTKQSDRVLVLAATNRPMDLDDAVIRRMPRRIFVPLPDTPNRERILQVRRAAGCSPPGWQARGAVGSALPVGLSPQAWPSATRLPVSTACPLACLPLCISPAPAPSLPGLLLLTA